MPTFYDSNGKSYALSIEIGRGGEGTVFYCPNDLSLVAKVYHEPIDEEKADKLRWMAANKNDGLLKIAAWIVDVLYDKPNGKVVGFVMPNVKAKEIHELYSLKSRRVHFPEATWKFLLHTAANVARAFYVLHKNDHIMGDVNHGNCVVLADGTVKLIDCDSYSIKNDDFRYRCDVGVATHLAPELQGIDLSEVEREKKHDNFGLAVIIFQLLFLGRHPFSGNYLGAEDKSLEDCIRERRFAYGNQQVTNVKQPPGTLSMSQLPPPLARMFTRSFLTEDRPEPREWIESLEDLSNNLKQCSAHIGHYYFDELEACPWCEIEAKTGLILFPFISHEAGEKGFNIFTVESLLASLDLPRNLPAKPFKPKVLPQPSTEVLLLKTKEKERVAAFIVIHFILVVIWTFLGGASSGISLGIFLGFGFYFINQKLNKDNKEQIESEFASAQTSWVLLEENEWSKYRNQNLLDGDLTLIRQKISEHQSLQNERREQLANLRNETAEYHLQTYLKQHRLEGLELRKNQLEALTRYGLQSAADIEEKRLRPMLALDDETKTGLLNWRDKIEKSFVLSPNADLPEVAKNRFEIEFTEKRRKVEKEIEHLFSILRSGSTALQQQQKAMLAKTETLATKLLQAESNLAALGDNKQIAAALLLITILVPTFGAIFRSATAPYATKSNVGYSAANSTRSVANVVNARVEPTIESNFKVNENITDKEIETMSANDRFKSAKSLYNQALPLVDREEYKKAEKKLSLAVKFADYDFNILYIYAEVLYNLQKHKDSNFHLEKALIIEPNNESTNLLIGANYMKMNRFADAEDIFTKVVNQNPESFDANFNLGLIYQQTNSYAMARYAFEKAVKAEPDNVEAHYEYGICLYKSDEWQNAKEQYDWLMRKDEKKAAKLWKIMNSGKTNVDRVVSVGTNVNVRNAAAATPTPPSYAKQ